MTSSSPAPLAWSAGSGLMVGSGACACAWPADALKAAITLPAIRRLRSKLTCPQSSMVDPPELYFELHSYTVVPLTDSAGHLGWECSMGGSELLSNRHATTQTNLVDISPARNCQLDRVFMGLDPWPRGGSAAARLHRMPGHQARLRCVTIDRRIGQHVLHQASFRVDFHFGLSEHKRETALVSRLAAA